MTQTDKDEEDRGMTSLKHKRACELAARLHIHTGMHDVEHILSFMPETLKFELSSRQLGLVIASCNNAYYSGKQAGLDDAYGK